MAGAKVYVCNWTEDLPGSAQDQSSKETNFEVFYTTSDSNQTMNTKIQLAKEDADYMVFPSSSFGSRMVKEVLLQPLDHTLLLKHY